MVVKNLRESRELLELKQIDVAKRLEVDNSTVSGWENGKDTIPIRQLVKYANIYKISLDYLFGLTTYKRIDKDLQLDLNLLAKKLKELRKQNNMTQKEVAQKINTTQPAYSHYEAAINIIPTTFLFNLTKIYTPFQLINFLIVKVKKTYVFFL